MTLRTCVALDVHAEDLAGGEFGGGRVGGEFDAACLAAAAGLHLGLDDDAAAEAFCGRAGFAGRVGGFGVGYGDAVLLEDLACLVLVQIHAGSCLGKCRTPPGHHPPDAG